MAAALWDTLWRLCIVHIKAYTAFTHDIRQDPSPGPLIARSGAAAGPCQGLQGSAAASCGGLFPASLCLRCSPASVQRHRWWA